ncbi:MAG: TonB-dependent receptor [Bacteroidales bacterium]|jgi:TonB-linked SusC/RagA family outer membrane protein
MKFKLQNPSFFKTGWGFKQAMRVIKISIVLVLATCFQVSAKSYAQMVSINASEMSLEKICMEIHQQTGYNFFYKDDCISAAKKVTVNVQNVPLTDALDACLTGQPITYKITGKTIVLTVKKADNDQQPKLIRGKISDSKGNPLSGANVLIKGTTKGTIADAEGNYTIEVPEKAILVFSFLGYQKKEIAVGIRNEIIVTLQEDIAELKELTFSAGYYNVKEREKTGSIEKVDAKTIAQQPISNPLEALIGRMPGVQITQSQGLAGAGFTIRIRGQNSIAAGNEPLYIIDGIPYDSKSMSHKNVSQNFRGDLSPFSLINPSDIESIEVLKDADATAIYGSRGANGVLLITTKKGKGGKIRFDVSFNTSAAKITKFHTLLTTEQYIETRKEAYANDGVAENNITEKAVNGTWPQDRYTDWQKLLLGNIARTNDFQASVSGGSSNTQFFLSGSYRTETSVIIGDHIDKRGSVLAKANHTSADERFKIAFSASYTIQDGTLPVYTQSMGMFAVTLAPNAPSPYNEDGSLHFESGYDNPVTTSLNKYGNERYSLLSNTVISYQILPKLEFKANLGYTGTVLEDYAAYPATLTYTPPYNNSIYTSVNRNNASRRSWTVEPQINWEHSIGKGKLTTLAGATFEKQVDKQFRSGGYGFPSDELLNNLSAASTKYINGDDKKQYKYQALFSRLNYNWEGKYIVNITGRRDGSSRFGSNKKFANFGAVGAAWIFTKEPFMKEILPFINFGKLRGSYGSSGNDQIGDYEFMDTYTISGQDYDGIIGFTPTRLFNPYFAWEVNKKLEIALDLGLLNDRIQITSSYFRNISTNQLVGIPMPATTGFTSLRANLDAKVKNSGLEIQINTVNFRKENFNWTSSFNVTFPKNELLEFPDLEGSTYANTYIIGKSLNIKKLYHNLGVNPETGIYEFEDYNNDGVISSGNDRQFIIDFSTKYYGGLANHISYKNLELDFFFQFSQKTSYNYAVQIYTSGNQSALTLENRWHKPGDQAFLQRYTAGRNSAAQTAADRLYSSNDAYADASYVRLKNISIAYTIPESILKRVKCRLYVQGQDLLTFTKYKGPDPEQPGQQIGMIKRLNFGIQFNF